MNKEVALKTLNDIFYNDLYGSVLIKTKNFVNHITKTKNIRIFENFLKVNDENIFFENINSISSYEN